MPTSYWRVLRYTVRSIMILDGGDTALYSPGEEDWRGVRHHARREKETEEEGSGFSFGSDELKTEMKFPS